MRIEMQKITNSSVDENDLNNSDDDYSSYYGKPRTDDSKSVNSNLPFRRASSKLGNPLSNDEHAKRTIQDTGATEDQDLRDSVSQVNRALRIVDDEVR